MIICTGAIIVLWIDNYLYWGNNCPPDRQLLVLGRYSFWVVVGRPGSPFWVVLGRPGSPFWVVLRRSGSLAVDVYWGNNCAPDR